MITIEEREFMAKVKNNLERIATSLERIAKAMEESK